MANWGTFGVQPPPAGASQVDILRFIRAMQLRSLVVFVPAFVVIVLVGPPTLVVWLAAVALLALLSNIAWLSWRIRGGSAHRGG